jgi:vesicular inhibitory amino acid transporter
MSGHDSSGEAVDLQASLLAANTHDPEAQTKQMPLNGKEDGATAMQTGLNMLNELEGSGLLGLPYALSICGWGSVGCLLAVGIMAGFTGYALAKCMYDADGHRVRDSYAAVGDAAFGPSGKKFVVAVQMTNLISVGIVYLVLVGTTMNILHPLDNGSTTGRRYWTAISTAVVMPTVHIGGYKKLSILSFFGILSLVSIMVIGIFASAEQIHHHGAYAMPEFSLVRLPAAFSMFLFAFSAHGIFPDLESSMKTPSQFGSVVSTVFIANIAQKAAFTFAGYFAYGSETNPVLTANLPEVAKFLTSALIVFNTTVSFPLPLVPVWRTFGVLAGGETGAQWNAAVRTAVVLFCGAVAVAVPDFALAMGFMGSLTLPFLTFIFPSVFYMRLHGASLGGGTKLCCCVITVLGVFGCAAGMAANVALAMNHGA